MASTSNWKSFEHIIAEIQKQIAPGATVTHDYRFKDNEGEDWQIDVLLEQQIGLINCRTIIECKNHGRPVSRDKIEGFPAKMRAVKAHAGIVMSTSGFSTAAKKFAEKDNFKLMAFREAEQADWDILLGGESWLNIIRLNAIDNVIYLLNLEDGNQLNAPFNAALYNSEGLEIGTLKAQLEKDVIPILMKMNELAILPSIGINWESEENFFIKILESNEMLRVVGGTMQADLIHEVFTINLALAEGKVIADSETDEKKYVQVISKAFSWNEVFEKQEGKILSKEDFIELSKSQSPAPIKSFIIDTQGLKPHMRIVLTKS